MTCTLRTALRPFGNLSVAYLCAAFAGSALCQEKAEVESWVPVVCYDHTTADGAPAQWHIFGERRKDVKLSVRDGEVEGEPARMMVVAYSFEEPVRAAANVEVARWIELPDVADELAFELRGTASGHRIYARIVDAANETFEYSAVVMDRPEPRQIRIPLRADRAAGSHGADANGILEYPIRLQSILIRASQDGAAASGELVVGPISAIINLKSVEVTAIEPFAYEGPTDNHGWQVFGENHGGCRFQLAQRDEPGIGPVIVGELSYGWPPAPRPNSFVELVRVVRLAASGLRGTVFLAVEGDGSNAILLTRFMDQNNVRWQTRYPGVYIGWQGWRIVYTNLSSAYPIGVLNVPAGFAPQLPIRFTSVILDDLTGEEGEPIGVETSSPSGTVTFGPITFAARLGD